MNLNSFRLSVSDNRNDSLDSSKQDGENW